MAGSDFPQIKMIGEICFHSGNLNVTQSYINFIRIGCSQSLWLPLDNLRMIVILVVVY